MPSTWTRVRSDLANAVKADPSADVTELRRQLKAARLEDHVRSIVNSAPPLSDEQRERIAALLRPTPGGGRVA